MTLVPCAAFADALRRAPGWADAWVNLGLARYRQGRWVRQSRRCARRCARRPATANLGAFLRLTGEAEESEALLREMLARTPEAVGVRLTSGIMLTETAIRHTKRRRSPTDF